MKLAEEAGRHELEETRQSPRVNPLFPCVLHLLTFSRSLTTVMLTVMLSSSHLIARLRFC